MGTLTLKDMEDACQWCYLDRGQTVADTIKREIGNASEQRKQLVNTAMVYALGIDGRITQIRTDFISRIMGIHCTVSEMKQCVSSIFTPKTKCILLLTERADLKTVIIATLAMYCSDGRMSTAEREWLYTLNGLGDDRF